MKKIRLICSLSVAAILVGLAGAPARADETVDVGGSRVILIKPKAPRGSVILMPGGNGATGSITINWFAPAMPMPPAGSR